MDISSSGWRLDRNVVYAYLYKVLCRYTKSLWPKRCVILDDLPCGQEVNHAEPRLVWINSVNDTYLEIPRYEYNIWVAAWCSILLLFAMIPISLIILSPSMYSTENIGFLIFGFAAFFLLLYCILLGLRVIFWTPRGIPVRFNRKRKKVYVYELCMSWNPLGRWPIKVKVFSWQDIRAERVFVDSIKGGPSILYCIICQPKNENVIDHFVLFWSQNITRQMQNNEMIAEIWSYCCHYMDYQWVHRHPLSIKQPSLLCHKNKIVWPELLDQESRSAE